MVGFDKDQLTEFLEKMDEDFEKGRIIGVVHTKRKELIHLRAEGSVTHAFFQRLDRDLDKVNTGQISVKDYERLKQQFVKKTQFYKKRGLQRKDAKIQNREEAFMRSLLEGSPVEKMTIASKISGKELADKKYNAISRLAGEGPDSVCQLAKCADSQAFLDIAESTTLSDAQKRLELTELLRRLDLDRDKELLSCFKGNGGWRGRGTA